MKKNKKEKILSALEKIMPEKRFHEITLDEVAQTAKVGKGTIYRYFKDKDDLFFQLAIRGFDEMCSILEEQPAPESGEDFIRHLVQVCERISKFFKKRRALLRLTNSQEGIISRFSPNSRERWSEHRQRLSKALGGVLEYGLPSGLISDELPVQTQARFLLSLLRGRRQLFDDNSHDRPSIETTVNIFLFGSAGLKKK